MARSINAVTDGSRLLLFDAAPALSRELAERLRQRGHATLHHELQSPAGDEPPSAGTDLAIVALAAEQLDGCAGQVRSLLERLVRDGVATIVCGATDRLCPVGGALVEWLDPQVGLDEIVGKVGTLLRYVPLVKGLERELDHLHRLGEQLNRHFGELDQELRLAGRLQRDFLPRKMPVLPPYRFDVLYRPASWVSGDMYDVFRIDEHHVGLFIADAMGHGVAAGLLTMFLRQALPSKQVSGNAYAIVDPGQALAALHTCLVRQQLPNCQFVTATYAILDTRDGDVRLARAGHPYPVHVSSHGALREVVANGSLLGLNDVPAEFEEVGLRLEPGDKLVFYTDGIEDMLVVPRSDELDRTVFSDEFRRWARLDAAALLAGVVDHLDCAEGSLNPADDITMLVLGVDRRS